MVRGRVPIYRARHDVSPAHALASRHSMRQRRPVGFLLVVSGGAGLACVALSLLPGYIACTLLIRCGTCYLLIPFGVLFVVVGIVLARSRPALLTAEEALSRQLYREILSEYARGRVILKIQVSMLLILGGASVLLAPADHVAWAFIGTGILSMLLGLGVLGPACLMPREERHVAAARERERQFVSRSRAITTGRTLAGDS